MRREERWQRKDAPDDAVRPREERSGQGETEAGVKEIEKDLTDNEKKELEKHEGRSTARWPAFLAVVPLHRPRSAADARQGKVPGAGHQRRDGLQVPCQGEPGRDRERL